MVPSAMCTHVFAVRPFRLQAQASLPRCAPSPWPAPAPACGAMAASSASSSSQGPPFPKTSHASPVTLWVRQTRQRLERKVEQEVLRMESRGALRHRVASRLEDSVRRELASRTTQGAEGGCAGMSDEEIRERAALTTLYICRHRVGMKSVWWEPPKSSSYILGRPVQVRFGVPD